MFRIACIGFLLIIVLPLATSAQIYEYRDINGNTIYTNDITRVPRDQQPYVKKYHEFESINKSSEPGDALGAASSETDAEQGAVKTKSTPDEGSQITGDLNKRKIELDKEFQALIKEKQDLDKIRPTLREGGKEAAASYNKRVSSLNEKIDAYEKKKEAFNAEVEQSAIKAESAAREDSRVEENFKNRKIELDKEYQALIKEKQDLDKVRATSKGRKEATSAYNKRVSALNERIDAYEKKKEVFNAEVKSYNAKVRQ